MSNKNMDQAPKHPFEDVPRHPGGHFVLYLYAAIYRLIHYAHRISEMSGSKLEEVFERYPFLAEYFAEMRRHMPEDITWSDATDWWEAEIARWEAPCQEHLPLRALARDCELSFNARLAFLVTGLVEEDSRFGTLFAEMQQPLNFRRPTLETVGQILIDEAMVGQADPWTLCRPLLSAGLVEAPDQKGPRSEWLLRVPPLLWDAARGQVAPKPTLWARHAEAESFPAIPELIFGSEFLAKIERLPGLVREGRVRVIILRSNPGTDTDELLGSVARTLGRGLISVTGGKLGESDDAKLLGPLASMTHSLPALSYELAPGETATPAPLVGYDGPLAISLGKEGGVDGNLLERAITLNVPAPDADLRERFWRGCCNGHAIDDLTRIVENFQLGGSYIRKVAQIATSHAALDGRAALSLPDVQEAGRALNRQMLDTLAHPLEATGSWTDLVCALSTGDKLQELELRCKHRERLGGHLGRAFGGTATRGVRALMTGTSGTGKSLAAKILAAELGMDLYRVDLAAVINKYIGETEKNLHLVLTRAESLDVVLLLDEGDALLGHRTEVKSANDRYANLETNYLLQRLENYQGIVLITTNLQENIDPAFQRRMDVVIPFYPPKAEERWRILLLHLADDHEVDGGYLELVARRCALTGGQIRNAALHASLLALNESAPVAAQHLEQGLRSEYRKAGGTFPLDGALPQREPDGGMDAFLTALAER